jgi:hypothetical protein
MCSLFPSCPLILEPEYVAPCFFFEAHTQRSNARTPFHGVPKRVELVEDPVLMERREQDLVEKVRSRNVWRSSGVLPEELMVYLSSGHFPCTV